MSEKQEISIPLELFDLCDLGEVGTIVTTMASPYLKKDAVRFWSENADFIKSFQDLMVKGVITSEKNDDGDTLFNINLKKQKESPMNKILKELSGDVGDEQLQVVVEMIENYAAAAYEKGYEDAKIDYTEKTFTHYGKKEDL